MALLALTGPVGAGWYSRTYGIDATASEGTFPTRLHTCGRDFDQARATVTASQAGADTPGAIEIGTWDPPLRTAVTILGRTNMPACGTTVYLERSPDDLVPYDLVGGP